MCVRVCVYERERELERERMQCLYLSLGAAVSPHLPKLTLTQWTGSLCPVPSLENTGILGNVCIWQQCLLQSGSHPNIWPSMPWKKTEHHAKRLIKMWLWSDSILVTVWSVYFFAVNLSFCTHHDTTLIMYGSRMSLNTGTLQFFCTLLSKSLSYCGLISS